MCDIFEYLFSSIIGKLIVKFILILLFLITFHQFDQLIRQNCIQRRIMSLSLSQWSQVPCTALLILWQFFLVTFLRQVAQFGLCLLRVVPLELQLRICEFNLFDVYFEIELLNDISKVCMQAVTNNKWSLENVLEQFGKFLPGFLL